MPGCDGILWWSQLLGKSFQRSGHSVKLISPQFVKPFVKTNKNDANDAQAIVEAAIANSLLFNVDWEK
jgi:transposase